MVPVMAAQSVRKALPTPLQKMRVQCREVSEHGDRHQEVPPRVSNKPLDLALVVTLARAAKPIREQVVRLQLAEHARALTLAVAKNAGNRDPGVVVKDRLWHPAEERKC